MYFLTEYYDICMRKNIFKTLPMATAKKLNHNYYTAAVLFLLYFYSIKVYSAIRFL